MSLLSGVETIAFHAKLKCLTVIERSRNDDLRFTIGIKIEIVFQDIIVERSRNNSLTFFTEGFSGH